MFHQVNFQYLPNMAKCWGIASVLSVNSILKYLFKSCFVPDPKLVPTDAVPISKESEPVIPTRRECGSDSFYHSYKTPFCCASCHTVPPSI